MVKNINLLVLIQVIFLLVNLIKLEAVTWTGDWAFACDFKGNDLSNARVSGDKCGPKCVSTSGCTHFTWTTYNGGTCWMKKGPISKSNAFDTGDKSMVCGVVSGSVNPTTKQSSPDLKNKFPNCQFKYGRTYNGDIDYSSFDYITLWIGAIKSTCPDYNSKDLTCTDFNPGWAGKMLQKAKSLNKPVILYGYIIAFEARNLQGLSDCNANLGKTPLCQEGANFIRNNRNRIIERYGHYSSSIANYLGTSYPTVFLIEPDFWQYYGDNSQNGGVLSGSYMRALYDDIAKAIKKNLPNALISWDISPWISESDMKQWWSNFASSPYIDFIHTSGGEHYADLKTIQKQGLTWSFMSTLTNRKIIADAGYGVSGSPLDNGAPWYNSNNIDNRIRDGVVVATLANSANSPTYRPKFC